MTPFEVSLIGLGVFAITVGLIVALAEWWDARHSAARKRKHA